MSVFFSPPESVSASARTNPGESFERVNFSGTVRDISSTGRLTRTSRVTNDLSSPHWGEEEKNGREIEPNDRDGREINSVVWSETKCDYAKEPLGRTSSFFRRFINNEQHHDTNFKIGFRPSPTFNSPKAVLFKKNISLE